MTLFDSFVSMKTPKLLKTPRSQHKIGHNSKKIGVISIISITMEKETPKGRVFI